MYFRGPSIYLAVVGLTSTSAVLAAVQPYGQCGGSDYQGETTCADGWACTKSNDWYSQCLENKKDGGNAPAPSVGTTPVVSEPAPAPTSVIVQPSAAPAPSTNETEPVVVPTTLKTSTVAPTPTSAAGNKPETEATPIADPVAPAAGSGKNGADCSLDAAFKAQGKKYIGVATDQGRLSAGDNSQIIKDNFGQVTPENRCVNSPSLTKLIYIY